MPGKEDLRVLAGPTLSAWPSGARTLRMLKNIFVLTGAGVSAESGLGTFRDKQDGIWARFDPMKLATPEAFARDPETVLAFYDIRRRNLINAKPNAAHVALARLESALAERGGHVTLVTQNIDDLHERAGSRRVIHMHGELLKARCEHCDAVRLWRGDLSPSDLCPDCSRAGRLRPHVVWFGEMPLHMDAIDRALRRADLFVAIGTSGAVYPAAGFVADARGYGVRTCEMNLEAADNADLFGEARYGPASETAPAWVEEVVGGMNSD
jgi:NAD-dependent protein deacetylase/lipoamidase